MLREPKTALATTHRAQSNSNEGTVAGRLTSTDSIDVWQFKLNAKSSYNLTLKGLAKRANADVFILNSANRVIKALKHRGSKAEKLSNLELKAGSYYIRVQLQPGSANTKYTLTTAATPVSVAPQLPDQLAGNFETATRLSLGSTVSTISDFVGRQDPDDFIQLTLPAPGQLNLSLTGLSADANVGLYDRHRQLIAASVNGAADNESIMQRLVDYGSTYYIRVTQAPGNDTNYTLNYALTPDQPIATGSGLQYVDLMAGGGAIPTSGKTVLVHYTGTLPDGTKFDSSRDRNQPFAFKLGAGSVIAGWEEGLKTMQVGGRRQLIIPPALGYGANGVTGSIPPNATLLFDVELLGIY